MPALVDTELAAGTSGGRTKTLAPRDVAQAVVACLRRPRFEVFVPRSLNALSRFSAALPQRGRDAFTRAVVPDQVAETDRREREAYERRRFGD